MSLLTNISDWLRGIGSRGRAIVATMSGEPTGLPWPPENALPRLRIYTRNAKLYLGEHEQVFVDSGDFKFDYDDSREYVSVNYLGKLSDLLTNRLFGDAVSLEAPEDNPGTQAFLEHLQQRNDMERLNIEAAALTSYGGDGLYKVRYDAEERRICIDLIDPAILMPETAPLNKRQIIAHNLGTVLQSTGGLYHLWIERHEMRDGMSWVTNSLYRLGGEVEKGEGRYDPEKDRVPLDTLDATAGMADETPTGIDQLLVVHVPNRTILKNGIWGISDYNDLLPIQGEINNRFTQRAEVQDKFVDPIVYGPDIRDENLEVTLKKNKYIIMPPEGTAPAGYLTWDAELASVVQAIQELRAAFAVTAGIDLTTVQPQEGGGPQSGRALRLSQTQTQDKVKGKQRVFRGALSRVYSIATKLATAPGVALAWKSTEGAITALEPEEIQVQFSDGLPALSIEEIEEEAMAIDAGIQAPIPAIMRVYDLTREEAEARWEEIQEAQQANAPAAGMMPFGNPFELVAPAGGEELEGPEEETDLGGEV